MRIILNLKSEIWNLKLSQSGKGNGSTPSWKHYLPPIKPPSLARAVSELLMDTKVSVAAFFPWQWGSHRSYNGCNLPLKKKNSPVRTVGVSQNK
jgi:hypothetical protein